MQYKNQHCHNTLTFNVYWGLEDSYQKFLYIVQKTLFDL